MRSFKLILLKMPCFSLPYLSSFLLVINYLLPMLGTSCIFTVCFRQGSVTSARKERLAHKLVPCYALLSLRRSIFMFYLMSQICRCNKSGNRTQRLLAQVQVQLATAALAPGPPILQTSSERCTPYQLTLRHLEGG